MHTDKQLSSKIHSAYFALRPNLDHPTIKNNPSAHFRLKILSPPTPNSQATKQLRHTAYYYETGISKRFNNIADYFYLAKLRNNFRKRTQNPKSIFNRSTSTPPSNQNTQRHHHKYVAS